MDKEFQHQVLGLGMNDRDYTGAFTPVVRDIIKSTVSGKVLHLYSGTSDIGTVRIDLSRAEATINQDVKEFCRNNKEYWDFILLDPPYALVRKNKLNDYADQRSLSADVKWRTEFEEFCIKYTNNVLWLDYCAPMLRCFARKKLWILLPGGYHTVRILSWLQKNTMDMFLQEY